MNGKKLTGFYLYVAIAVVLTIFMTGSAFATDHAVTAATNISTLTTAATDTITISGAGALTIDATDVVARIIINSTSAADAIIMSGANTLTADSIFVNESERILLSGNGQTLILSSSGAIVVADAKVLTLKSSSATDGIAGGTGNIVMLGTAGLATVKDDAVTDDVNLAGNVIFGDDGSLNVGTDADLAIAGNLTLGGDIGVTLDAQTIAVAVAGNLVIADDTTNAAEGMICTITIGGSVAGEDVIQVAGAIQLSDSLLVANTTSEGIAVAAGFTELSSTKTVTFNNGFALDFSAATSVTTLGGGSATDTLKITGTFLYTFNAAQSITGPLAFVGASDPLFDTSVVIPAAGHLIFNTTGTHVLIATTLAGTLTMDDVSNLTMTNAVTTSATTASLVVNATTTLPVVTVTEGGTITAGTGAVLTITSDVGGGAVSVPTTKKLTLNGPGRITSANGFETLLTGELEIGTAMSAGTIGPFVFLTDGGTLDVNSDATITSFTPTGSGTVELGAKLYTTAGPIVIPTAKTLTLSGTDATGILQASSGVAVGVTIGGGGAAATLDVQLELGAALGAVILNNTDASVAGVIKTTDDLEVGTINDTAGNLSVQFEATAKTLTTGGITMDQAGNEDAVTITGNGLATITGNISAKALMNEFIGQMTLTGTLTIADGGTIDLGASASTYVKATNTTDIVLTGSATVSGQGTFVNTAPLSVKTGETLELQPDDGKFLTVNKVRSQADASIIKVDWVTSHATEEYAIIDTIMFAAGNIGVQLDIVGKKLVVNKNINASGTGDVEIVTTADGSLEGDASIVLDSLSTFTASVACSLRIPITVDSLATVTATGNIIMTNGISVASGDTLKVSGAGDIINDKTSTVSIASGGVLQANSTGTVTTVSTVAGGIIDVLNNTTIDTLVSTSGMNVDFSANRSLTIPAISLASDSMVITGSGGSVQGGIITLADTKFRNDNATVTILNDFVFNAGSVFDMNENLTLTSPFTIGGDFTMDIASGKVLTYNDVTDINVGNNTLTLAGPGTFTNTGDLVLNAGGSTIAFASKTSDGLHDGTSTVNKVEVTYTELNMSTSGGNGAITTLTLPDSIDVTFTFGSADTLTINSDFDMKGKKTFKVEATNGGMLDGTGAVNLMQPFTTLDVDNAGATKFVFGLDVDVQAASSTPATSAGLDTSATVMTSGTITMTDTLTFATIANFNIVDGTLTYAAGNVSLLDTLNVTGAGRMDLMTSGMRLDSANTVVKFASGTPTISRLSFLNSTSKGLMAASATVDTLLMNGNDATFTFTSASAVLTFTDSTTVASGEALTFDGLKAGTIAGTNPFKMTTNSSEIWNKVDGLTISKPFYFTGSGIVNTDSAAALTGAMVFKASSAVSPTFKVASGIKTTYSGGDVLLGDNTLTIFDAGSLATSASTFIADSTGTAVNFTAAGYLGSVTISKDAAVINATTNGTIGTIVANEGFEFDINTGLTLTVDGAFTIGDSDTLFLDDVGTLAGEGAITIDGVGALLKNNEDGFTINKPIVAGGTNAANFTIYDTLTVRKLTLANNLTLRNKDVFIVTDTLATSATAVLYEDSSKAVDLNGAIMLSGDLTLTSVDTTDNFDYAGLTAVFGARGSSGTLNITTDTTNTVTFGNVAQLGTTAGTTMINVAGDNKLIKFTKDLSVYGTYSVGNNDTVRFSGEVTIADTAKVMTTDSVAIVEFVIPSTDMLTLNGTINANAGLVEVKLDSGSVGTTTVLTNADLSDDSLEVVMAMGASSLIDVDGTGKLILPSGFATTMANGAEMKVDDTGYLTSTNGDSLFTFNNTLTSVGDIDLISGTVKYIQFADVITGTATNLNNVNYTTAIFVNVYYDSTGIGASDGTPEKPFTTIEEGITVASAGLTAGEVRLAAGLYSVDSTLVLDNVSLIGSANTTFDAVGIVNSWTSGTTGLNANKVYPTINFTGTGAAIQVKTDEQVVQGLKIVMGSGNTIAVELADTLDDVQVVYNEFEMMAGQTVTYVGGAEAGTGVDGLNFNYNKATGAGYTFLMVDHPDSTTKDVDVTYNDITGGASYIKLGTGDIDDVLFKYNNHTDGAGVVMTTEATTPAGELGDVKMQYSKFMGAVDFAYAIAPTLTTANYDTLLSVNGTDVSYNHFFFPAGGTFNAVSNGLADSVLAVTNYVSAENNWWGASTRPTNVSTGVDYNPWKFVPALGGSELIVVATDLATATAYTPIMVTVYTGYDAVVEISTNFAADIPVGKIEVMANDLDANNTQSFYITPLEAKTGAWIKVKVDNSSSDAVTRTFNVAEALIAAPGALDAADFPDDNGGYVMLTFTPSANHAGYGTADLSIDYYQVYASTTDDFATASNWAVIPATPKASGQGATISAVVSTRGVTVPYFFWISAVKGDMPPGMASTVNLKVSDGFVLGYLNEDAPTAEQTAIVDVERIVSSAIGPNRAIAAPNIEGYESDFSGDGVIDLTDVAIFAGAFGHAGEYELLFDFDADGRVGLLDLMFLAGQFGKEREALAKVTSVGKNSDAVLLIDAPTMDNTDMVEVKVKASKMNEVAGYQFSFNYDKVNLEFVEVRSDDTFEAAPLFIKNVEDGKVTVASVVTSFNEEDAVQGDKPLATLVFKWIGDDQTEDVTIDNIKVIDTQYKTNRLPDVNVGDMIPLPDEFELKSNYPNPFNPVTTLRFTLPKSAEVTIEIYNVLGQKVRTLVSNTKFKAGIREAKWNATNDFGMRVASGTYIYTIKAENFVAAKKMLLIK